MITVINLQYVKEKLVSIYRADGPHLSRGASVTSPVSTMMACPEGKKEQKFVTAWLGEDGMLRYNSKLPIVVYTPANVDVKYRIWKADANVQNAVAR